MIRNFFIAVILLNFLNACTRNDVPEVVKDFVPPSISQTAPSSSKLHNKDFPIHITGVITDNYLQSATVYVLDSFSHDTLYEFPQSVEAKTGYIYNEEYYNPSDSGFKIIYVVATDNFKNKAETKSYYFVY